MAAIERIFAFLDLKPEITDHALSRSFAVRNGTVQFDDVSFAYGSRNQQQGPQGTQNQNGRIVPNQQQPTVAAPPQQNNRSFNPGTPNNNQPPAARPQPPARQRRGELVRLCAAFST